MALRAKRVISRNPERYNYYLVDACFLANKYLQPRSISDPQEKRRIEMCLSWWSEIDRQLKQQKAKVFVLDICIAETFKVFAKKRFQGNVFRNSTEYSRACNKLRKDIHLPAKEARKQARTIVYHDIQMNRDIIISVDRFFEKMHKRDWHQASIVDLTILATGKYLIDFYGFSRSELFLVTIDKELYHLAKSYPDVPRAFNPILDRDGAQKVFCG
jgi:hypothetical protein